MPVIKVEFEEVDVSSGLVDNVELLVENVVVLEGEDIRSRARDKAEINAKARAKAKAKAKDRANNRGEEGAVV
eukprot:12769424-Heterocapsa_arctica.AAC.1